MNFLKIVKLFSMFLIGTAVAFAGQQSADAHNFARLRILYQKMLKTSGTARGTYGGMVRHELNTAHEFFRNLDRLAKPVNRRMRQFSKHHSG